MFMCTYKTTLYRLNNYNNNYYSISAGRRGEGGRERWWWCQSHLKPEPPLLPSLVSLPNRYMCSVCNNITLAWSSTINFLSSSCKDHYSLKLISYIMNTLYIIVNISINFRILVSVCSGSWEVGVILQGSGGTLRL